MASLGMGPCAQLGMVGGKPAARSRDASPGSTSAGSSSLSPGSLAALPHDGLRGLASPEAGGASRLEGPPGLELDQPAHVYLRPSPWQSTPAPRSCSMDSLLEETEGEDGEADVTQPRYIAEDSPSRLVGGGTATTPLRTRWPSNMSGDDLEAFVGTTLLAAATEWPQTPLPPGLEDTAATALVGRASPLATSVASPPSPAASPLVPRHPEAGSRVPWASPTLATASPESTGLPVVRLDLAQALPEPELGSEEVPTLGSAMHRFGTCKPCAFLYTKGCVNATQCPFCHLCDAGEKKRRQKEKKDQRRDLQRWAAESFVMGPAVPALPVLPMLPVLPPGSPVAASLAGLAQPR